MNKIAAFILVFGLCACAAKLSAAEDWTYTPLPLLFYTSDTGIAGGGLLVVERQANELDAGLQNLLMQTAVTYTQKSQLEVSALFQSDFGGGLYRMVGNFGFFNTPSLYYGVGPQAEVEEAYEQRKFNLETSLMRKLWRQLYAGGLFIYNYVDYTEIEPGGALAAYLEAEDSEEVSSEAGVVLQWDSRDSLTYPRRGSYVELRATAASPTIGSESAFNKIKLDARTFWELLPDTILALQGVTSYGSGEMPLHRMEELGGLRVLRGYRFGRYRDKSTAVLQGELRFPLCKRFGGVAFAGGGLVGKSYGEFRMNQTKVSGGVGLRFRPNLNSDVRIRLDIGLCEESIGVYITLLEAF